MNHTVTKANGNSKLYHDLTQVQSQNLPPGKKMRTGLQVYRVTKDICVAKGIAKNNPQFGNGGATQYYVPASENVNLSLGKKREI